MKLDANTSYEIQAEAFRIMTGHMAPGKDVSPLAYSASGEERFEAWKTWRAEHSVCVVAMLTAVQRVLPGDDE